MREEVILRRIPPRTGRQVDRVRIPASNRRSDPRHHPGKVDGIGLQAWQVEVGTVGAAAAVQFRRHLAHHRAQCPATAVVSLGHARSTPRDGVRELMGEVVKGAVLFQVADPVGVFRRAGVDEGGLQALFQLLLQVAAVHGVVDDGGGGVVEEVLLQLLDEGGLGVDALDAQCGVHPLQQACGDHGGGECLDVLALAHVIECLAEVAFVVDVLRMRQP